MHAPSNVEVLHLGPQWCLLVNGETMFEHPSHDAVQLVAHYLRRAKHPDGSEHSKLAEQIEVKLAVLLKPIEPQRRMPSCTLDAATARSVASSSSSRYSRANRLSRMAKIA